MSPVITPHHECGRADLPVGPDARQRVPTAVQGINARRLGWQNSHPGALPVEGRGRTVSRSWSWRTSHPVRLVLGCYNAFALVLLVCSPSSFAAENTPKARDLPPATPEQIEKSIRRGIDYLLKDQNKDGSWGSARKTKDLNIFAPVPGAHDAFRSAVTAMCISALIETGAADTNSAAREALMRAETWLLKKLPEVRRADGVAIYNVWAHSYGIHALVEMYQRETSDPIRREQIKDVIVQQFDLLRRYESVDGGWGYYDFRAQTARPSSDATSFTTATALIAFREAKDAGIEPPKDVVKRGIASIVRQRKNDFTYDYGEYLKLRPMLPINRPGGSLGRSQACNLALRVWGDTNITDTVMTNWLQKLIDRNEWLSFGRKRPIPHESWFQVAGYFFYYGHYYAALCIEDLGPEKAGRFRPRIAAIITNLQEKDGSWFDYPFYNYHQQYGAAFALMNA